MSTDDAAAPGGPRNSRVIHLLNRPVIALQRLGLAFGPIVVLTIPGRVSGKMRSTPVALTVIDGERYVIAYRAHSDWAANARAAGWAMLRRGRSSERVALVELAEAARSDVLREIPAQSPRAGRFYRRQFGIDFTPDALAGLAPRVRAFHLVRPDDVSGAARRGGTARS